MLCLYRPPVENTNHFIEQLNNWTLKYLERAISELIICGDTNINSKEQLQELFNMYNLLQVIEFPTRIGPNMFSFLDK